MPRETVGFRAPALTLIRRELKRYDLRVGNPLRVGIEYTGHQGNHRVPFTVTAAESFSAGGVQAVWNALVRRGEALSLFPLELQREMGIAVDSAEAADRLYAHLRGSPVGSSGLTLYSVAPLRPSHSEPPRPVAKLLPTRMITGRLLAVWAGDRADGGGLDVVGGKADACKGVWELPADAMRRELGEELPNLPIEVIGHVEQVIRDQPEGVAQRLLDLTSIRHPQQPQRVHYWCLPVGSGDGCPAKWAESGALRYEWAPTSGRWVMPTALLQKGHEVPQLYTRGMLAAVAADPAYHPQLILEMALRRWARKRPTPQGRQNTLAAASASVSPLPPRGRVALVLCSHQANSTMVLCKQDARGNIVLPEASVDAMKDSRASAALLATSILADASRAKEELSDRGAAVAVAHRLPSGLISAVACGASSLPLALQEGAWVWVPAKTLLQCRDAISVAAGQAAAAWYARTPYDPRPPTDGKPCYRRPRTGKRRGRPTSACTIRQRAAAECTNDRFTRCQMMEPEAPAKLGRVIHAMAAKRGATIPMHLRCQPEFITEWHQTLKGDKKAYAEFRPALTSAKKHHKVQWNHLGVSEDCQRKEKLEAIVAAAMTEYHAMAQSHDPDRELMERIMTASRQRAKVRGASDVTPKDVAEAARAMDPARKKLPSPAEVLPVHYDKLMAELASVRASVEAMVAKDVRRPRVLVAGERHSVVACMYRAAGADVATCDLEPSDSPSIPHFQGDMQLVLDLGWDLIVGHPPCTYLSNAGSSALHKDPSRVPKMEQSAALFRRLYCSDAPFIAVENPTMHRHGRERIGLGHPDQYVQPYQHGTPHQKRTGFHLKGLPLLKPSCEVEGRERPMANLPEVPERSDLRSRTYIGIAGAMAMQWMPTLMAHVASEQPSIAKDTNRCTARSLIQLAVNGKPESEAHVMFRRFTPAGEEQLLDVEVPGGTACSTVYEGTGDNAAALAAIKAMRRFAQLPQSWITAATNAVKRHPSGDHRASVIRSGAARDAYFWIVDIAEAEASLEPVFERPTKWHRSNEVLSRMEMEDHQLTWGVRQLLGSTSRRVITRAEVAGQTDNTPSVIVAAAEPRSPPSPSFMPWRHPPDFSRAERPPAPVSKLHYVHGSWRAWSHVEGTCPPQYAWQPTAANLNAQLCQVYGRRRRGELPLTGEEARCAPFSHTELSPKETEQAEQKLKSQQLPLMKAFSRAGLSPTGEEPPPSVLSAAATIHEWHENLRQPAKTSRGHFSEPTTICPEPYAPESLRLHEMLRQDWARSDYLAGLFGSLEAHKQLSELPAIDRLRAMKDGTADAMGDDRSDEVEQPRLGLGADPSKPPSRKRPLYMKSVHARRVAHQVDFLRFVPAATSPTESRPTAPMVAAAAPELTSYDSSSRPMSEVVDTPKTRMYHHCLYTQDVTVCRRRTGDRFWVDCALTDSVRALTDTGAAPSIITTELLAQLPRDALVTRDHEHVPFAIEGPDGGPLALQGHATIVFDLRGKTFRHKFIVAEGKPLLIFGCDFLAPWKAVTEVNQDGDGRGVLRLGDHEVRVTTNPADLTTIYPTVDSNVAEVGAVQMDGTIKKRPIVRVASAAPKAEEKVSSSASSASQPEPIFANSELTGLSAGEIARKRLTLIEGSYILYASEAIVLPPMTKRQVFVRAPEEVVQRGNDGVVTPLPLALLDDRRRLQPELHVVKPDAYGKVPVTLWNTSRQTCTVPALTPICGLDTEGTVHTAEAASGGEPRKYADLPDHLKAVVDKIKVDPQNHLNADQLSAVWDLLAEFADVFAIDPKEPKHTHLLEVELELKPGAQPHRHAPSRIGPAGQKIVDEHIDDMESRNIIRKSNSAWGSRVVLVSKKDGSIRFCVDYRDTNSKLQVMDSPIPLTAEAIDRLASGQGDPKSLFLSTLDLASGFWCLPIREADKALTSFVTHRGKYEFNYLPFGIQSGPSYMSRLMDAALQGLAWDICMPYIDDTGVWSTGVGDTPEEREHESYKQMLHRLRLVFERFRWAQLSCKASKCEVFATSASYLGHVVGRDGLSMDPKKLEAIGALDTTKINTLTGVRSFLGLASYYRRFVKGFAGIAAPLHDLTKDGVDVAVESQEPKAQGAMKNLIAALVSEPVLATPRFDRQFIVKTDAAVTEGIGGVLSQHDDDKKERVNAYYGRRLRKAENNWTVTEVELLAALESISNWRPYLWGREFRLIIDHSALRWLHTMRDTFEGGPASRLTRWIMKLQEYRFTVEHKPGVAHCDADGVSRLVQLVAAAMDNPNGDSINPKSTRSELKAWAEKVQPDGAQYASARTQMLTAYWERQQPQKVGAAVVTARGLQAAARAQKQVGESRVNIINYYLGTGAPSTEIMKREQATDPDCKYLMDLLISGTCGDPRGRDEWRRAAWGLREARHLEIRNGLLYRLSWGEAKSHPVDARLYVPASQRVAMMTAFHEHFGHQSEQPMIRALRKRYYWPAMHADVTHHTRECHECTLAKRPARRRGRAYGPSRGHYPFDLVYVDVLDMADTHDYEEGGTGYRKLLVFVDSLTRWVEAVPFHSDPTSEQVLDAFMTHIVARHGCPRTLRSDLGSNFASDLCDTILEQTGCKLRPSSAEHHESVGAVERFNSTISSMVRAADEGGLHWVDHLPFLLMSYRATPHRVTKQSPAALLYGRELRLPSQIADPEASSIAASSPDLPSAVADYAMRLHENCVWAWQAASAASLEAQSEDAANAFVKTIEPTFAEDDRVARLLPGPANKLKYLWSGPYRIAKVMADGRYQLRDLENRIMHDEFDASNLRPYRTVVDAEDLAADEYLIDYLIGHRDRRGAREFRVKWRGFPRSEATWEPRSEIERRAASLVLEYESSLPTAGQPPPASHTRPHSPRRRLHQAANIANPVPQPPAAANPAPAQPLVPPNYVSEDEATEAEFSRGVWRYGRRDATQRGSRIRWYPPSHYLPEQLQSTAFEALRSSWKEANPTLATVVAAILSMPAETSTTSGPPKVHESDDNFTARGKKITAQDMGDGPRTRVNPLPPIPPPAVNPLPPILPLADGEPEAETPPLVDHLGNPFRDQVNGRHDLPPEPQPVSFHTMVRNHRWPPENQILGRFQYRSIARQAEEFDVTLIYDQNDLDWVPRHWGAPQPISVQDQNRHTARWEAQRGWRILRSLNRLQRRLQNIIAFANAEDQELRNRGITSADLNAVDAYLFRVSTLLRQMTVVAQNENPATWRPLHTPLSHEMLRVEDDNETPRWTPSLYRQLRANRCSMSVPCEYFPYHWKFVYEPKTEITEDDVPIDDCDTED